MTKINYDDKRFTTVSTSSKGDVSNETIFHYHQRENFVWAEYSGGEIIFGNLIAKCARDGSLDMRYQHLNGKGELMTGTCQSTPKSLSDGRIRLYEAWKWTSGDQSEGKSILEEI